MKIFQRCVLGQEIKLVLMFNICFELAKTQLDYFYTYQPTGLLIRFDS